MIGFIKHEIIYGISSDGLTRSVCRKAQGLVAEDWDQCKNDCERTSVLAAKSTAQVLAESAKGTNPDATLTLFKSLVENLEGGKREINLGGRNIKNKKSARENWQRAAAIMLWKRLPEQRNTLATEATEILDIKNKAALAKLVDNFDQKYDPDYPYPVGIHFDMVTEIYKVTGWCSLKDY